MREIVHIQAGQCGNQIGAKVKLIDYNKKVIFRVENCLQNGVIVSCFSQTVFVCSWVFFQ